ncbi:MAG TPA: hypothetical protein VI423_10355 [Paenisporosarcina sp.]|nr:hypothetical protein [Paenisporosarcina sp.]
MTLNTLGTALEKLIANIIEKLFSGYFRGMQDEMYKLNMRLASLEAQRDVSLKPLATTEKTCCHCGGPSPCFKTHIVF